MCMDGDGVILHDDQKQRFSAKQRAPLNKKSHTISKFKPKIRIIHIFAPEIIKTDATNFRELVQRLTGKPPTSDIEEKKSTIRSSKPYNANNTMRMIERLKGEEEIWTGTADSGCGFIGDDHFADFDGIFMQDLHQISF